VTRTYLPSGTVTFLFTDIEGSTKLLDEVGPGTYQRLLTDHRAIVRRAFGSRGGAEVDTQGDAFFYAFADAPAAVQAATEVQAALASGPVRIRIGIHTGQPTLADEGYVGRDVHLAARIAAAGHGGQVLISRDTRAAMAESVAVTDLGEHRLKDFSAPVWLYQLGGDRFPPLKTISNTNLPRPASSFVGRDREVGEITELLRDGARLLTLTGPGGTGKTRLAIEAAAELVPDFRNGVFWVDLAPLRDDALVLDAIRNTLGARDGVAEHIGQRQMLLVIDNLEQVIAAAPDLAGLPEQCPNLRLLTTSRELLRVRGETEFAVDPLPADDAVELFTARAQMTADDSITELCRRLEGLPLAVELAAARARMLSPTEILERLGRRLDLLRGGRDADSRQRTLRATVDWSYELLATEEKTLFARLAVFRGGFLLDAVETVCQADLDVLQAIVDKSLVRRVDDRFTMLETIREFAAERLEASGEGDELRRRHAQFFIALAEEADPQVKRGTPKGWLDRLEADHDNLRAALDHLESAGATQSVLQLAGALMDFWLIRGHFKQGRARLETALAADTRPTRERARALHGAVMLEDNAANLPFSQARAEEELRIYEKLGDRHGIAFALQSLGAMASLAGDWTKARATWDASRAAFKEVGDDHFYLAVTRSVAWMSEELGDAKRERALVEEFTEGARRLGNQRVLARGLGAKSTWAIKEGRFADALALLGETYRIDSENGFVVHIAHDLVDFAMIALGRGKPQLAAKLVALSDRLHEDAGTARESWAAAERDKTLAAIRASLAEPAFSEAWRQGRYLTADEAVALVTSSEDAQSAEANV
jgi:predicted ATPase/class 3 adenylate cyclase